MLESLINQDFWVTLAGAAAVLLQFVLTASVILRVILTRHPPGSSFAWILLVTILPYIGFILYVWLGERPIGRWRALRLRHLLKHWEEVTDEGYAISGTLPTMPHGQRHKGLTRLAERLGDLPMSCGSRLELISDSVEALSRIEYDVNNARKSVSMEFYIWGVGGWCDRVAQAIIRASERGCECRILVDDIGARAWLRSSWPSKMLAAGVHVSRALPVSLFPITKGRADLRLHRKTVIIDDHLGYTGSLNLIDPHIFNATEGVGEWVDAMVRVEGTAVRDLNQVFLFDWALQPDIKGERISLEKIAPVPAVGSACVTVVPSGPTTVDDANQRLILEAISCARERIYLTTPYFIPDESVMRTLCIAGDGGVDVRLMLPGKPDHWYADWVAESYFGNLLAHGVKIYRYTPGFLHAKSIMVDREAAFVGSVNMDYRSFELHCECGVMVYGAPMIESLLEDMDAIVDQSHLVTAEEWAKRSVVRRVLEPLLRLFAIWM